MSDPIDLIIIDEHAWYPAALLRALATSGTTGVVLGIDLAKADATDVTIGVTVGPAEADMLALAFQALRDERALKLDALDDFLREVKAEARRESPSEFRAGLLRGDVHLPTSAELRRSFERWRRPRSSPPARFGSYQGEF